MLAFVDTKGPVFLAFDVFGPDECGDGRHCNDFGYRTA